MSSAVIVSSAFNVKPSVKTHCAELSTAVDTITQRMEAAIEKAQRKAAYQFLRLCRRKLAKFNTKNHDIRITAAMGSVTLDVNGEAFRFGPLTQDRAPHRNPLLQLLEEIDVSLDYDWAWHLDGEKVN